MVPRPRRGLARVRVAFVNRIAWPDEGATAIYLTDVAEGLARGALSALLLALNTVAPGLSDTKPREFRIETPGRAVPQHLIPTGARTGARPFARTELYFGTARPGGVITEAEFHDFVDRHVTPRFPQGLTLLKGDGRFPSEDTVIKEQSFVLILLYTEFPWTEVLAELAAA